MKASGLLALVAAMLVVGSCAGGPAPVASSDGGPVTAPFLGGTGQLVITVKWPLRVQVIPYSTNRIVVEVSRGQTLLASSALQQATGVTTSQAQLNVPAGEDLTVTVAGYQDALLVAEGQATASVQVNKRNAVGVRLSPKFAPVVQRFSPNGGTGANVTIIGTQFGASRNVPFGVTFGGIPASSTFRLSDTELVAVVPAGVATGSVVVRVDGVDSAPAGTFTRLTEASAISPADPTVGVGDSIALQVTVQGPEGQVAKPEVAWSLLPINPSSFAGMPAGTFSAATGSATVFTATATGSAYLAVRSGALISTTSIVVQ